MSKPKVIQLVWIDSATGSSWDDNKNVEELSIAVAVPIQSIGFLIHENKDTLTITQSIDSNPNSNCNRLCIPKVAIKKRRNIKL